MSARSALPVSSGRRGDSEHDHVKTPYQHLWTTRVGPRASNLPRGFHPSRQPPIPSQGASNPCPDRERRCRATLAAPGRTYEVQRRLQGVRGGSVPYCRQICLPRGRYVVHGTTADPVQSQRCDPSRVSGAAGFVGTSFWNGKLIVWRTGPSFFPTAHAGRPSAYRQEADPPLWQSGPPSRSETTQKRAAVLDAPDVLSDALQSAA
jgi:hypothetical protein